MSYNSCCCVVNDLIEAEEKQGIPSSRIIVGGFSQGGALTLYSTLKSEKPLAGAVVMSAYLPLRESYGKVRDTNMPIFMAHGTDDQVVKYEYGKVIEIIISFLFLACRCQWSF